MAPAADPFGAAKDTTMHHLRTVNTAWMIQVATNVESAVDWDAVVEAMMVLPKEELLDVAAGMGMQLNATEKRRTSRASLLNRMAEEVLNLA